MTAPKNGHKKLRLVKVICQPVFAIDDGSTLVEQVADPVAVPAADWPGYATGQFADAVEQLETALNQPGG